MKHSPKKFSKKQRGTALISSFAILGLLAVGTTTYLNQATQSVRMSSRQTMDITVTAVCEAGTQAVLRDLWRPFKISQKFDGMDDECSEASLDSPASSQTGTLTGVGRYSAGVIAYEEPEGDPFVRNVTIRSVGWVDSNDDGQLNDGEARKIVDVNARYELARSAVFDYTYFVNNYGWMDGFGPTQLIVNGDMRANANFDFLNGSPTVNGSVYAAVNDKLTPAATGLINTGPVKSTNAVYTAAQAADRRMRQAYTASLAGTKGSETYEKWRDFVFDSEGSIVSGRYAGAVLADSTGYRGWTRTSSGATAATTTLDTTPTKEIIMPDLSDLDYYQNLSSTYVNEKATFADGTANPEAGKGAYLEVWDATLAGGAGAYKRLDTNGNVSGSVMVVGSSTRPIKIHGPVTVSQDVVIKGVVQGQGTLYAGRNVHIVGSVTYKDEPDFRGTNLQTIDNANEKKDFLGLAARASVVFGNPKTFADPYPLKYMKPPFTKARVDEAGNTIPAYNATEVDGTGKKKYQSTFGDDALHAIASGINQVDAIVYTNFVGGGNLGTGGGGVKFNGTIISRDEAMVIWSLPVTQNYDNRIRERFPVRKPLIDLMLPRSPTLLRSTWQDHGFGFGDY
jgi:hypothetical protein